MSTKLQLLSSLFRICILLLILMTKGHTANPSWRTSYYPKTSVCDTEECEKQGKRLMELINFSLDPCDDFYEYVCSKWAKKNPAPPNYDEWSIDTQLQLETFKRVQELLEEPITQEDSTDLKNAKEFQHECMKTPYFDIVEPSVVRNNINPIGYFPLISTQKIKVKPWQVIHDYYLSFTGESGLFSIFWRGDRRNNNAPLLCIRESLSPFGLIKGFVPMGKQLNNYIEFLTSLLKQVMPSETENVPESQLTKGLYAVMEFRIKMYKMISQTNPASNLYHPITVETMDDRYKQITKKEKPTARIDWVGVIHHFYGYEASNYVIKSMKVNVENKAYFQFLAKILSKTPADVIVNHIHLYFIERHTALDSHMKSLLMNVIIEKGRLIGKIRYLGNKAGMCLAMNGMKETIGKLYVKRYFPSAVKKKTDILAKELKDMLTTEIEESTWLTSSMKNMFTHRVADMNIVIGYPEYYKDKQKRFENPAAAVLEPIELNAFYLPSSNVLSISAAYLNPPIYSPSLPYAMRYSGLGEYIAHEMYHGFGPHATEYIQRNVPWPKKILDTYGDKMSCFIDKFDKIPIQELKHINPAPKIDGLKTLEENVADLMGLKLAYWTFRKKVWDTKKCEVLPHMFSLTCDHLFFISFASLYCTTLSTDTYLVHLKNGEHATPRLRVNEATSNFEVFNELFHCTKEKDINRQKTCDLWK